jgi:hypothetical protein
MSREIGPEQAGSFAQACQDLIFIPPPFFFPDKPRVHNMPSCTREPTPCPSAASALSRTFTATARHAFKDESYVLLSGTHYHLAEASPTRSGTPASSRSCRQRARSGTSRAGNTRFADKVEPHARTVRQVRPNVAQTVAQGGHNIPGTRGAQHRLHPSLEMQRLETISHILRPMLVKMCKRHNWMSVGLAIGASGVPICQNRLELFTSLIELSHYLNCFPVPSSDCNKTM